MRDFAGQRGRVFPIEIKPILLPVYLPRSRAACAVHVGNDASCRDERETAVQTTGASSLPGYGTIKFPGLSGMRCRPLVFRGQLQLL